MKKQLDLRSPAGARHAVPLRRRSHVCGERRAFTLVEILAVMGIIALLAGLIIGISVTLRRGTAQKNTRMFIERIQSAMELYENTLGEFPPAISQYVAPWEASAERQAGSIAAAQVLLWADVVGSTGQSQMPPEINSSGYLVDHWGSPINIVRGGFNSPGLDIWSSGENRSDEYPSLSNVNNPTSDRNRYGDDIVNWKGR